MSRGRVLRAVFILLITTRLLAAVSSLGFDHPNEPFRLLEPMASFMGFSAVLPWEWTKGLLSELPVFAHLPWVAAFQKVGASPIVQLVILKLLYATLSLVLVWSSVVVAEKAVQVPSKKSNAGLIALGLAALWPEQIYQSVRLMDYSLEAVAVATAWFLLLRNHPKTGPFAYFSAGSVLALAFFVRPQSGLHLISMTATIIFIDKSVRKGAWRIVSGYGATVFALAMIESVITSKPYLGFFRNYIQYNLFDNGAARDYGSDPWHRYATETLKYFGWVGIPALLIAYKSIRRAPVLQALVFAFAFPILIHSLISHKEGRFVYGGLWLLIPIASAMFVRVETGKARTAIAALAGIAFLVSAERVSRRWFTHTDDVIELAAISRLLSARASTEARHLEIQTDPISNPAGFLLQQTGSICYSGAESRDLYPCKNTGPVTRISKENGNWKITEGP